MKSTGLAGMMIGMTWISGLGVQAEVAGKKPNIIFLLTDDLGWGDLGCYGNPYIKTPNLDRLAREGKMYVNWYANAPVCSPTRAAVLTGQYPSRNRVFDIYADHAANEKKHVPDWLDPNLPQLLPRLLQKAGYATGHFGKWHLNFPNDTKAPPLSAYGYDESRSHVAQGPNYDSMIAALPAGEVPATHASEWQVNETIDFISRHREQPFFVNVWFMVPHAPLAVTEEQRTPYKTFRALGGRAGFPYTTPHEVYYSAVTDLDRQIGRLLDQLKEWGVLDNTLIVFSSDNGPENINVPQARHSGVGSAGVFRGQKRSLYEGGLRVPGIVRWPAGGVPAGVIDRSTVASCMDLYSTFLEVAGVALPAGCAVDSVSLLDSFRNKPFNRPPLCFEYNSPIFEKSRINRSPRLAVRDGEWKLLANPDGTRLELYNLTQEPAETDNVLSENTEVAERMKKTMLDWFNTLPSAEIPTERSRTGYENILGVK
jgi:N-acetylgalactosamine-6-sulfatase